MPEWEYLELLLDADDGDGSPWFQGERAEAEVGGSASSTHPLERQGWELAGVATEESRNYRVFLRRPKAESGP